MTSGAEVATSAGFSVEVDGTAWTLTVRASDTTRDYTSVNFSPIANGTWSFVSFVVDPVMPGIQLFINGAENGYCFIAVYSIILIRKKHLFKSLISILVASMVIGVIICDLNTALSLYHIRGKTTYIRYMYMYRLAGFPAPIYSNNYARTGITARPSLLEGSKETSKAWTNRQYKLTQWEQ